MIHQNGEKDMKYNIEKVRQGAVPFLDGQPDARVEVKDANLPHDYLLAVIHYEDGEAFPYLFDQKGKDETDMVKLSIK